MVKLLLDKGSDPKAKTSVGLTPLRFIWDGFSSLPPPGLRIMMRPFEDFDLIKTFSFTSCAAIAGDLESVTMIMNSASR